jgi:hypothetical protein
MNAEQDRWVVGMKRADVRAACLPIARAGASSPAGCFFQNFGNVFRATSYWTMNQQPLEPV